jgi:hypothetical protein
MVAAQLIAKEVRRISSEKLGAGVLDVRVFDKYDMDGQPALSVEIVVSEFDPRLYGSARTSDLVRSLILFLRSKGDQRFPFLHFATREELADSNANDD